jgi:hypothetical protein
MKAESSIFSLGPLCFSDVYRHESGTCCTIPFFQTFFIIICCDVFLAVRVFGAPQTIVRIAMAVRVVAHNTINALCSFYLDRKLRKLLIPPRIAHLIKLLQSKLSSPSH